MLFMWDYSYAEPKSKTRNWQQIFTTTQRPRPSFPGFPTKYPPCCGDLISAVACKRLKFNNPQHFQDRCETDPDFSLIQCCHTCGLEEAPERHQKFFADGERSKNCFDRHEIQFCEHFLERTDFWGPTKWSCSGENAHLAFRICRKTCGYCKPDLYDAPGGGTYKPTACGSIPEPRSFLTEV
uniref:ShKT domain-containing protein n=1 Tax=Acrobeloides nanus TaxID=290746 RepID=A0A914C795_9BILA